VPHPFLIPGKLRCPASKILYFCATSPCYNIISGDPIATSRKKKRVFLQCSEI